MKNSRYLTNLRRMIGSGSNVRRLIEVIVCLTLVTGLAVHEPIAHAGIYNILLNSPSQSNVGSSFTVVLSATMVKDSAATGQVSGKVLYPSNLVRLTSISGGSYPNVTFSTSTGSIGVSAPSKGAGNGYGGNLVLFTATFSAVATGTANFTANSGVMIVNGTNHTVIASQTVIYAQSCPAGQVGTPPNCSTPPPPTPTPIPTPTPAPAQPNTQTKTPTKQPTPSTSSPTSNTPASQTPTPQPPSNPGVISGQSSVGITVLELSITSVKAKLSFTPTSPIKDARVIYGTDQDSLSQSITLTNLDSAAIANLSKLTPSTKYYYQLEAKDEEGKQIVYKNSLTTKGFPIQIAVVTGESPRAGEVIKLNGTSFTTDDQGTVVTDMPPGEYRITDTDGKQEKKILVKRIGVSDSETLEVQTYTYNMQPSEVAVSKSSGLARFMRTLALIVCITLIGGLIALVLRRRKKYQQNTTWPVSAQDVDIPTSTTAVGAPTMTPPNIAMKPSSNQVTTLGPEPVNTPPVIVTQTNRQPIEGTPAPTPYNNVSLADMFVSKKNAKTSDSQEDYDPFLNDSPFARGKDLDDSRDPRKHVK